MIRTFYPAERLISFLTTASSAGSSPRLLPTPHRTFPLPRRQRHFSTTPDSDSDSTDSNVVPNIVSTDWLASNLSSPNNLVIFDATWYPRPFLTENSDLYWRRGYRESLYGSIAVRDAWNYPATNTHAFNKHRIPGARYLDIDTMADTMARTPRKLPVPEEFAQKCTELGLVQDDHIVVYDARGTFSSPRVHWLFKSFGHEKISVLEGGLPKWLREKKPVETGEPTLPQPPKEVATVRYTAKLNEKLVLDYQKMWDSVLNNFVDPETYQVVDARLPRVSVSSIVTSFSFFSPR